MEPSPPLPPGPAPPLPPAKTKYAIYNPASAPTCRFFTSPQGCAKGSSCQFRHDAALAKAPGAASVKSRPARKQPCRFFLKGQCRNGAQCSFSHENVSAPAPLPDMTQLSIADETVLTRDLLGPFFAIDVECVATGTGHLDRDVARIAIVSEHESTLFDAYVKPAKPVVSYLTQLTGITAAHLEGARTLAEVLTDLRAILPKDSVLVGQSVDKDVAWLGLKEGEDFRAIFDVAMLFRMPNTKSSYRYFSLRHVVKYLLEESIQETDHDPVVDAIYAMKVFKRFRHLHESPAHRHAVLETLAKTPQTPSFAKRHPIIDGVALAPPPPTAS